MDMRRLAITLTALVSLVGSSTLLRAKEGEQPNLAVKPEVQTAAWAQSWWMPRHEEKLEALKGRQVDLLMIGDSITHSWENGGKAVWEKYYADRNAFNIGFSGDRTENVLWRLQHGAVDGISPKLAVVMIGTNNTGHRQDEPAHTAAGVRAILDELQTRLPKTKILLLAIFPRGADAGNRLRKINDATNAIIAEFADDQRVFYLDINDEFLDDDGTLPKSIMPDLLHPNPKGYEIWAAAMEPMIKRLMGEEK
jgi:beta-glucosidase